MLLVNIVMKSQDFGYEKFWCEFQTLTWSLFYLIKLEEIAGLGPFCCNKPINLKVREFALKLYAIWNDLWILVCLPVKWIFSIRRTDTELPLIGDLLLVRRKIGTVTLQETLNLLVG
jgi:hypothetical protein